MKIFFITADSLRADFIDVYGYKNSTMPNLGKYLQDFAIFDNFFANGPNTPASFPAIFTGTFPLMYGGYKYIHPSRKLIFEYLKEAGFYTAAFNSNPYVSDAFNYYRGVDYTNMKFNEYVSKERQVETLLLRLQKLGFIYKLMKKAYYPFKMKRNFKRRPYKEARQLLDDFFEWYERVNASDNVFVWLHFMDTHHPFNPPNEFIDTKVNENLRFKAYRHLIYEQDKLKPAEFELALKLYEGEIRYVDWALDRFFHALKEKGDYEDSLIIFTADHGEEFLEHGDTSHKSKLYDELIHIPLFVKFPGNELRGRYDFLASSVDLLPTVLDVVGAPSSELLVGTSLKNICTATAPPPELVIAQCEKVYGNVPVDFGKKIVGARSRTKKLIYYEGYGYEYFDLESDPHEKSNIYEQHKNDSEVAVLREAIQDSLEQAERSYTQLGELDITEDVKEKLAGLGYL